MSNIEHLEQLLKALKAKLAEMSSGNTLAVAAGKAAAVTELKRKNPSVNWAAYIPHSIQKNKRKKVTQAAPSDTEKNN